MITAEIKMGTEYSTNVHGETIEEVLDKIRYYHLMDEFAREVYTKKGKLQQELDTGWYIEESKDKLLEDAIELIEGTIDYVPPYFMEKHKYQEDYDSIIKRYKESE